MLANWVVVAGWRGAWVPRAVAGSRRLAARLVHALRVEGARRGAEAERRARFEHEARAAALDWLMM